MGRYKLFSYKDNGGNPYLKLEADNIQFTSQAYHASINVKGMEYQSHAILHYDSQKDEILHFHNTTVDTKQLVTAMKNNKTAKGVLIEVKKTMGEFHTITKILRLAVTGKIKDPNAPNAKNAGSGGLANLFGKKK